MNSPYAAYELVSQIVEDESEKKDCIANSRNRKSIVIADGYAADCEMIAVGAYTPLRGFMTKGEVDSIVKNLSSPEGYIWGVPIILTVSESDASAINPGDTINLTSADGVIIAEMKITDKFKYDKILFCRELFRTNDLAHPGAKRIIEGPDVFLGGPIRLINRPKRKDICESYYLDPKDTRKEFKKRGWSTIVSFQTRNPIHRAHEYLIKCALEHLDGVLIHPLAGETKPDDIPASIRMLCYRAIIDNYFNRNRIVLSVLPTFMRYAGPREAINHAIIRKNYGCTHFIIGRDHAGVGNYYGAYDAQRLVSQYASKIGIETINYEQAYYCRKCNGMVTSKTCAHPVEYHVILSGTIVREMLKNGNLLPDEFSRKEVSEVLINWSKRSVR